MWCFEYNKDNKQFSTGDENIAGITQCTLTNNGGTFEMGDTKMHGSFAASYTTKLNIVSKTYEQISLVGMLYDAPVLVSYYPKMKILIWSHHSLGPTAAKGSKVSVYYTTRTAI